MIEALLLAAGVLLFLAGFYTGVWIQRHSYTDREVPKIITTEKLVEVEKPIVIQVPRPPAPSSGGLPIMGTGSRKNNVLNPEEKDAADRMSDLLGGMPEI